MYIAMDRIYRVYIALLFIFSASVRAVLNIFSALSVAPFFLIELIINIMTIPTTSPILASTESMPLLLPKKNPLEFRPSLIRVPL